MTKKLLSLRDKLVAAALLHDIGKFMQRSEEWTKKKGIRHPQLSATFINPTDTKKGKKERFTGARDIAFLAAYHHEEDLKSLEEVSDLFKCAEILNEADNLASGERRKDLIKDPRPLKSVFSVIGGQEKDYYWGIRPLSPEEVAEPGETLPDKTSLRMAYERHWQSFSKEFESMLKFSKGNLKIETLCHLLRKYLWCVPASFYQSEPDISLYDHSRMAAAIAAAMLDWFSANGKLEAADTRHAVRNVVKERSEERYLLVCGDISGIQRFIYQVADKGAARSLKGRSFYLQLLSDAVAKFVLRELGYPVTNLIYSSGGKFYILTSANREKEIAGLKQRVNSFLLERTKGALYFSIGAVRMKGADFILENMVDEQTTRICKRWDEVNSVNARDKMRRYAGLIKNVDFFSPQKDRLSDATLASEDLDDLEKKDEFSKEMVELGRWIRKKNFIIAEIDSLSGSPGESSKFVDFKELGLTYHILYSQDEINGLEFKRAVLYNINHSDGFLMSSLGRDGIECGYRFYGGNLQPHKEDGSLLTYDELSDSSTGIKRLGVLRMDVDNLGKTFREGLGRLYSISRLSTLSFQLDFFFNAMVHHFLSTDEKLRDRVLLVYTGGDDLFAVGAWDAVIDAAVLIKEKFRSYCSFNPRMTLSAGVELTGGKYPVRQGALLAGKAEDMAKELDGKDGVSLMEVTCKWSDMEISRDMVSFLVDKLQAEDGEPAKWPKSFLSNLENIYLNYQEAKEVREKKKAFKPRDLERLAMHDRWRWMLTYQLTRFVERKKEAKKEVEKIQDFLIKGYWGDRHPMKHRMELLPLILRYSRNLLKSEGGSDADNE